MKIKIATIIICLIIAIMMLAGCELKREKSDEIITEVEVKTDELSKRASKVINNYEGKIQDEDYKEFKSLVLAEESRQICIQNIAELERTITHTTSMISFFERYGDQEEVEWYQSKKEKAEETLVEIQKELDFLTKQEEILLE